MSNSESTGKTVALVIFFLLFVTSSIMAYVFWSRYEEQSSTVAAAQKEVSQLKTDLGAQKQNYEALQTAVIGSPPAAGDAVGAAHEGVMEVVQSELSKPEIPPGRLEALENVADGLTVYPNMKSAIGFLETQLTAADKEIESIKQDYSDVNQQLVDARSQYAAENDVKEKAFNDLKSDKEEQSETFKRTLDSKDERIAQAERRLTSLDADLEQAKIRANVDLSEARKRADDLAQANSALQREKVLGQETLFEAEDGEVIQVPANNTVIVNLGSKDGLRVGTTFGVYGFDAGTNPYSRPKADVEVRRILSDDKAEAIVKRSTPGDPILAGDLLSNPVWDRGDTEGIAFVGLMFLDADDKEDNDTFERLVEENGGKIDAKMDLGTGKVVGPGINASTEYLVIGDIPEASDSEFTKDYNKLVKDIIEARSTMLGQAKDNGVRVLDLPKFLRYMGKNIPQRTVRTGEEGQIRRILNARAVRERTGKAVQRGPTYGVSR